jgi:hypothetical protein
MKAYVITTGLVFAALAIAHIARLFAEGAGLLTEPFFVVLTAAALGLAIWAAWLLKKAMGSTRT